MTGNELRTRFLQFFVERGHKLCPSDSLAPEADPTLLFTGAGMNQFKDMFLGKGELAFRRATSCQKCLRTGDIENVGVTPTHHTFFEMLGNFSFGDYFKEEAITWAWEFLTKELGLPEERLFVSVYVDDEEAADIWTKKIGIPLEKLYRFGAKDNFWPANAPEEGPNGPCGPCSEIFFDWGPERGCGRPDCDPSCDCHRFLEIWNLVFTQFDRRDGGELLPLPQRNIDTGMGLERIASVMQNTPSNFETDLLKPIVDAVADIAGIPYDRNNADSAKMRRIADHARAVAFCICDGVFPSNEGRGYVERRLLRRAVRDGIDLGIDESFLYRLVPVVADVMKEPYPELEEKHHAIALVVKSEEDKFRRTLQQGTRRIQELMAQLEREGKDTLPGCEAFRLYDTYGFPLEMTESILAERGFKTDREGFEREMERQREMARAYTQISEEIFDSGVAGELKEKAEPTEFIGYETTESDGTIVALVIDEKVVDELSEGQEGEIVLDRTPFYGESGGQVGDRGTIETPAGLAQVKDTQKLGPYILHKVVVKRGAIRLDEPARAVVDAARRRSIMRNHTATHLLHKALRDLLGAHVAQAGSLVAPDRLRFDFSHFEALTPDQIAAIERAVNEKILEDHVVETYATSIDEAKAQGAVALFGEKYGETVRVVRVDDYSMELCGGTHVGRTGQIGLFKVLAEESIAAGTRRIEAVTGMVAYEFASHRISELQQIAGMLSCAEAQVVERVSEMAAQVKALQKEIEQIRSKKASGRVQELVQQAKEIDGVRLIAARIDDAGPKELRTMVDTIRKSVENVVAVLACADKGKVQLVVAVDKALTSRGLHAGNLARDLAKIVGGGGGGRPELAQAGGAKPDQLDAMLAEAETLLRKQLEG